MVARMRDILKFSAAVLVVLPTLFVGAEGSADEDAAVCQAQVEALGDTPDRDAAVAALMDGFDFGCFGGSGCTSHLCVAVTKFESIDDEDELRRETAVVVGLVQDFALSLPQLEALAPMRTEFQRWSILGALVLEQREDEIPRLLGTTDNIWVISNGRLFGGRPPHVPPEEVDLFAMVEEGCAVAGPACRTNFDVASDAATAVNLQRRIVARLSLPGRVELAERTRRADARWSAYFSSARSQLPWELLLNSALYDADREPLAIKGPPTSQWIVMHPSLGVAYTTNRSDDIDQAIVLELVGYYRWRWGGENKAEIRRPFGGSLVLSFDGRDDPAIGAMVHLPRNWSLGGTIDRDENFSLLLSLDVVKFIQSNEQVRRVLTGDSLF